MRIPYRTRRALGRMAVVLLVLVLVLALAWLCWLLWLGRFVVYTAEGAKLDFSQSAADMSGEPALPPEESTVSIYYNEGENAINVSKELTQMAGYYVSGADLRQDISAVRDQLRSLPAETPVMVEVKNIFGEYFYSSNVSQTRNSSIDPKEMDSLLRYLKSSNLYTIARVSAFQDYTYGLNNVDEGLFSTGGAYLWRDDVGCYWLNPARERVVSYLVQTATELKALGFDEVVFDSFCFPESKNYVFNGDKEQTLTNVANTILTTCGSESFAISFMGDPTMILPEGRTRLYVKDAEPSQVGSIVQAAMVPDTAINLVFVTELHDTRFDVCSVLRPISAAH